MPVHQTNQPPQPPPPQQPPPGGESTTTIWPILVVVLVLVLALLWFIFAREDAEPRGADRTEVEANVPAGDAPDAETPARIEVDLPERVDVNIGTEPAPEGEATQTAPPAEPPGG